MDREISFQFPYFAWLILLLIPFGLGQVALGRYRSRILSLYTSSSLLSQLMIERSPLFNLTKNITWGGIWILGCLALMGPFGNIRYVPVSPEYSHENQVAVTPHEVVFLVDTSASMRVKDGYQGESRLESSKSIMEDLLQQLHGEFLSVYAFTSELTSVVPPTLDYVFARMAIYDLQIDQGDVGGTRFTSTLSALKEDALSNSTGKQYTILLFSDGGDTQLEIPSEREKEKEKILSELSSLEGLKLRLFTIGVGGKKGEPIPGVLFNGKPVISKVDPDILQLLASEEGGEYYSTEKLSFRDLSKELMQQINKGFGGQVNDLSKAMSKNKDKEVITDLYYQVPLGIALLFYFFNLLLPDVRRR